MNTPPLVNAPSGALAIADSGAMAAMSSALPTIAKNLRFMVLPWAKPTSRPPRTDGLIDRPGERSPPPGRDASVRHEGADARPARARACPCAHWLRQCVGHVTPSEPPRTIPPRSRMGSPERLRWCCNAHATPRWCLLAPLPESRGPDRSVGASSGVDG